MILIDTSRGLRQQIYLQYISLMGAKCWAIAPTPSLCAFDPLDHLHCGRGF